MSRPLPPGVHHAGFAVTDLERSVAWYEKHLGFTEIARNHLVGPAIAAQADLPTAEIDTALLAGSNTILELLQYRDPAPRPYGLRPCDAGAAHVCVVVDDLERTCRRMADQGVHFHAEPCSLIGAERMVYVRDPDGVMVELLEPTPDITVEALISGAATARDPGSPRAG